MKNLLSPWFGTSEKESRNLLCILYHRENLVRTVVRVSLSRPLDSVCLFTQIFVEYRERFVLNTTEDDENSTRIQDAFNHQQTCLPVLYCFG